MSDGKRGWGYGREGCMAEGRGERGAERSGRFERDINEGGLRGRSMRGFERRELSDRESKI
jgi:hypothetical protein